MKEEKEPLKVWIVSTNCSLPGDSTINLYHDEKISKDIFEKVLDDDIENHPSAISDQMCDDDVYNDHLSEEENLKMFKANALENGNYYFDDGDCYWQTSVYDEEVK